MKKLKFGGTIESFCPIAGQALLSFLGSHNYVGHLIDLPVPCNATVQFVILVAANSGLCYCIFNDIILKDLLPDLS